MRITSVIEHDGEPALGIPYTNTDGVLFRVRIKALTTGIILEGFYKIVAGEDHGIIALPHILKVDEQVAYDTEPVRMGDIEAWYESDECISLLDYLAMRDEPEDVEQDHQDHEPDTEPDVVQNEPETGQNDDETVETRELTDLQRSVLRCLSIQDGSVADIADTMGRTSNSDKVQIRKACHELVDTGLVVKKNTIIQNGRPAQIWGVL